MVRASIATLGRVKYRTHATAFNYIEEFSFRFSTFIAKHKKSEKNVLALKIAVGHT